MLTTGKALATAKKLIRKNSVCCLKNEAFFSHSERIDRFEPSPPVRYHALLKDLSSQLYEKRTF